MTSDIKSSRGRARSEAATKHIQSCALALAEQLGPERVTIEGISETAGIAKTTIYRRWPNAGAVIMDAFLDDIGPSITYRKEATLSATFRNVLGDFLGALDGSRLRLLRHLLAAAQADPELALAFWERWIAPRREQGFIALSEHGVVGEQANATLDLLFGAAYYRILIPYAPLDPAWIDLVVAIVFKEDAR